MGHSLKIVLLIFALFLHPVQAEEFPSKPLRAIVPFPAGSGTDAMARFVGESIRRESGQTLVVENMAGTNGLLGARAAAGASPDGYSLFFSTNSTHAANPYLFNKLPYDPIKDFEPVALLAYAPLALVIRTDSQFKSLQDLISYAKANPGKLNFGTANTGSLAGGHMLNKLAGINTVPVSYRGSPQAVTDLLGGQFDFMIMDMLPIQEHIRSGSLRALAVTSATRLRILPDVPTMVEAGVPGYELFSWNGVHVPAGTPREIVVKLNQFITNAVSQPEAVPFFDNYGAQPSKMSPDEFARFQATELERWGQIIPLTGLAKQ